METEGGRPSRVEPTKSRMSIATSVGRVSHFSSVWGEQSQVLENEEYLLGEMNLFSQSKKVFDLIYKQNPSYVVGLHDAAIRSGLPRVVDGHVHHESQHEALDQDIVQHYPQEKDHPPERRRAAAVLLLRDCAVQELVRGKTDLTEILKPGKGLEFTAIKTDSQGGIALHFR